ncbi:hypothetical protein SDC9_140813 [bioreactor metagenome]|uniref:Uncharacterized protein n=1 Tax=bioreactor metagenome TaxID=1076179 RepID=A0A645DYK3_9ZZZZ
MGGQQIAFNVVGNEGQCLGRSGLALCSQPLRNPGRQAFALWCVEFNALPGFAQGLEPTGLARLPVHLGQGDQGQGVAGQLLAIALQRVAAFAPRFAGGNAQVDEFVASEQGHVTRSQGQCVPTKTLADDQGFALCVTLLARGGPDRIAGL